MVPKEFEHLRSIGRSCRCEAVLPRCTVGSRQAEHESQGVDGRGRYGNEVGNSLSRHERDEPMRREGLQARGIYKEVPRPSRRLGLATRQKIPYSRPVGPLLWTDIAKQGFFILLR